MINAKRILLTSLLVIAPVISSSQVANAATWDDRFENWVYTDGVKMAAACAHMADLSSFSVFVSPIVQEKAKKVFYGCDTDQLIFKLDVCPKHDNKYPVCSDPNLSRYIHARGLDSATITPPEWWHVAHPEEAAQFRDDSKQGSQISPTPSTPAYPGLIISKDSQRLGLTDEQYLSMHQTDQELKISTVKLSASVEKIIKDCENKPEYSRSTAICVHDMLYWKGRCMTGLDVFSFCGPSGSLQKYLIQKNLADGSPVRTFITVDDNGILKADEKMTNENIKELK